MAGSMLATLLFATLAFSIAYAYLMAVRTRVGRVEDRVAGVVMTSTVPRARAPRRPGAPERPADDAVSPTVRPPAYAPRGGRDA
jgi:hypothetical protein